MPLRGLHADAAYLSALLNTIAGPMIVVGHSYGGSIISHPSIFKARVKGLVFAAAFIPDAGESTGELNGRWPGSKLGEATVLIRPYPGGNELYLKPEAFASVCAGDLPAETVAQMAAAQRPIDLAALGESSPGVADWPVYWLCSSSLRFALFATFTEHIIDKSTTSNEHKFCITITNRTFF